MTEPTDDAYQVCYKHPDRKTYLRCNQCNKPICLECAVRTPTGYRCKDCIKAQQQVFNTSEKKDYIIGSVIAAVLGLAGAFIYQRIPLMSLLSAVITGGLFGTLICNAVRAAVNKRRSDTLNRIVMLAAGFGGFLGLGRQIILNINLLSWGFAGLSLNSLMQILADLLYVAVLCITIRSNMSGMVFRR